MSDVSHEPPSLYSIGVDYQRNDGGFIQKHANIVHSSRELN